MYDGGVGNSLSGIVGRVGRAGRVGHVGWVDQDGCGECVDQMWIGAGGVVPV